MEIVNQIEEYKKKNGVLPNSVIDINMDSAYYEKICYQKVDSVNYMVWFGTILGESMTYYSDTKKWEETLREMK